MIATRRDAAPRTARNAYELGQLGLPADHPEMVGSSKFRRTLVPVHPFSSTRLNVISHLAVGTEAELAEDRKKHADSKVGAKVKGER
jgi:hypothetical protein